VNTPSVLCASAQPSEDVPTQAGSWFASRVCEPFSAESPGKDRRRKAEQKRCQPTSLIGAGLGAVRGESLALETSEGPHIHAVGESARIRKTTLQAGIIPSPRAQSDPPEDPEGGHQTAAVGGRLEDYRGTSQLGCPDADPVDLHMIRVAVSPRRVIDGKDVRRAPGQFLRQDLGRLLHLDARKGPTRPPSQAVHARVVVSEAGHLFHAENRSRGFQLPEAHPGKLGRPTKARRSQACLTGGGADQADPVACGGRLGQGPSGEQNLVVGVSVKRYEAVGQMKPSFERFAGSVLMGVLR